MERAGYRERCRLSSVDQMTRDQFMPRPGGPPRPAKPPARPAKPPRPAAALPPLPAAAESVQVQIGSELRHRQSTPSNVHIVPWMPSQAAPSSGFVAGQSMSGAPMPAPPASPPTPPPRPARGPRPAPPPRPPMPPLPAAGSPLPAAGSPPAPAAGAPAAPPAPAALEPAPPEPAAGAPAPPALDPALPALPDEVEPAFPPLPAAGGVDPSTTPESSSPETAEASPVVSSSPHATNDTATTKNRNEVCFTMSVLQRCVGIVPQPVGSGSTTCESHRRRLPRRRRCSSKRRPHALDTSTRLTFLDAR
jgi:hypothetical protein